MSVTSHKRPFGPSVGVTVIFVKSLWLEGGISDVSPNNVKLFAGLSLFKSILIF